MSTKKVGPLLMQALAKMETASDEQRVQLVTSYGATDEAAELMRLPVVIQTEPLPPESGEHWPEYRDRVSRRLEPMREELRLVYGARSIALHAANAIRADLTPAQVAVLAERDGARRLELDPVLELTALDDVAVDIGLPTFRAISHPGPTLDGNGVIVAVLDSGIDARHPHLVVFDAVSTCGEDVAIPGDHGTHCAGIIASRDSVWRGVAPAVKLIDVKVLRANGTGTSTSIVKGIDEALDRDAHVLSMSVGFNHLPAWSDRGHGWACPAGGCSLCVAVNNASLLDDRVVVVAAGNEHARAEALRRYGYAASFDTEITCPGHAQEAITVGALTKSTFLPADFSSRGPTADQRPKPDLVTGGVNVTSTVPVARDANGQPVPNPPRASLFARKSGTSMATPVVAGAAALLIQRRIQNMQPWNPRMIRQELASSHLLPVGTEPAEVVGRGRLRLR